MRDRSGHEQINQLGMPRSKAKPKASAKDVQFIINGTTEKKEPWNRHVGGPHGGAFHHPATLIDPGLRYRPAVEPGNPPPRFFDTAIPWTHEECPTDSPDS